LLGGEVKREGGREERRGRERGKEKERAKPGQEVLKGHATAFAHHSTR
jgi:hypothetical protein